MIIVVLKKGSDYDAFKNELESTAYTFKHFENLKRFFSVDVETPEEFSLKDHPDIKFIDPNKTIFEPVFVDRNIDYLNKPYRGPLAYENYTGDTWALPRMCRRKNPFNLKGLPEGGTFNTSFRSTRTGAGVDTYIIDLGVQVGHVEFGGRVTKLGPDQNDELGNFHGIGVASCVTGSTVGIAPSSEVFVHSINVGFGSEVVEGMDLIVAHYNSRAGLNRPATMNLSITDNGAPVEPTAYWDGLGDLIDMGITICCAAGNLKENYDVLNISPAETDPDLIIVGASNIMDGPMLWHRFGTAFGSPLDIHAPGMSVKCAYFNDEYIIVSGTSFSSPYTAGILNCMLEGYQRPTTRAQVQAIKAKLLENSTKDVLDFPASSRITLFDNNKLVYIDPHISIEPITGLTPL